MHYVILMVLPATKAMLVLSDDPILPGRKKPDRSLLSSYWNRIMAISIHTSQVSIYYILYSILNATVAPHRRSLLV